MREKMFMREKGQLLVFVIFDLRVSTKKAKWERRCLWEKNKKEGARLKAYREQDKREWVWEREGIDLKIKEYEYKRKETMSMREKVNKRCLCEE